MSASTEREITCELCGEITTVYEYTFRVVSQPLVIFDDGDVQSYEYTVDWDNDYALDRAFHYGCCGERVKDEALLDVILSAGETKGGNEHNERAFIIGALANLAGREREAIEDDIDLIAGICQQDDYDGSIDADDVDLLIAAATRLVYALTGKDAGSVTGTK